MVRDPELLKSVLITEFNSFHDNDFYIDEKVDPMFGKNPFVLKGDRWKVARNQLIPCFTTKKVNDYLVFKYLKLYKIIDSLLLCILTVIRKTIWTINKYKKYT